MSDERPQKSWRLNYWEDDDDEPAGHVTILAKPNEVRMGVGKTFVGVSKDRLSLSGGFPSTINIQGLSSSMRYAGMLQDSPFPIALLPSTMMTPFPKQIVMPPFLRLLPEIGKLASVATAFIA